ncbi:NAD-dependent epimerase/dehydratase family protein [Idiomarina abyssalis]|uniref:NAD-dependent epimerase/dehydratase family protein n=1 Tax=Idiomarina abyssalis TaxID=86102 RepID=UPI003A9286D8
MLLITGGRGFVGRSLIDNLGSSGFEITSLVKPRKDSTSSSEVQLPETRIVPDLLKSIERSGKTLEAVIHCAGLAHGKMKNADYEDYKKANVELTEQIAEVAIKLNVKKFVFFSTAGVYGRSSESKLSEESALAPYDYYSRSKLEAENLLIQKFKNAGLESKLVIIRPPLIVGPNPPGSLGKLIRLSSHRIPLPFGDADNKRTILSLDNLIDFIKFTLEHEKANGIFTLADDEILSTRDMIALIRNALNRRALLVPIPKSFFKLMTALVRRPHIYEQLFGDLMVSNSRAKSIGWKPIVTSHESIMTSAQSYNGN